MPLERGEEPLDRHGQELGAAEAGPVAEDVGRVEPLAGDVASERRDESGGDVVEDAGSAVVVADALLVAFESTGGDRGAGLEVQGIRDVGSEDGGLEGLLGVPSKKAARKTSPAMEESSLVGAPRASLKC